MPSMSRHIDEKELIERLNARDEAAIEEFFHRYYAALCLFCDKITSDREASKDIVQEIFARLFEKRHYKYENSIALKTFLYTSVRNGAIDHIRLREKSRKATDSEIFLPTDDVEADFLRLESDVILKVFETIERLPEACRAVFKMSYIDRMSVQEVAAELNIAESTVKTQRRRAKEHLRKWLGNIYFAIHLMIL
jgi:RNA polymerase sigma-70 factor (ECF subfamily)